MSITRAGARGLARVARGQVVLGATGVLAAAGLWQAAVAAFDIRTFFLPSPLLVAEAFTRHGPHLATQAGVTLGHTLAGFTIATTAAVATAAVLATSSTVRKLTMPLLVAAQNTPKVAFLTLLLLWFGFGASAKIALVVAMSYFPVLIATLAGLGSTPAEAVELARSMCGTRTRIFYKIRIPYALPQMFTGFKLGLTLALIGAVVAQINTPNSGLGAVIVRAGGSADTPLIFAAIVTLSALGTGLFYTLTAVERLALPWTRATTA